MIRGHGKIAAALALAGAALLPSGAAAKGPPCPPGPVAAEATFKPRPDLGDGNAFVARIEVERSGHPLRGQVPYVALARRQAVPGSGYRPGYLYFASRATNRSGTAWVTVTVPRSGRWNYQVFPCPDGQLQQRGPTPAAGVPGPRTPAPPGPARPTIERQSTSASDEAGASWSLWIGIAAALAAATALALLLSARARARAGRTVPPGRAPRPH